jgi:carboxypeptidase C (cathepsin A)
MTEQGPFKPEEDGTLRMNPYAWNQVANMVFIEAPAGVGFSYAQNTDDYNTGDKQTAIDNYNTIQSFLKRFPEYQTNDLYITSESYGDNLEIKSIMYKNLF